MIAEMKVGEEITAEVCYATWNFECEYSNTLTVTRCPGDYYVYWLQPTPHCFLRHSGSF